MAHTFVSRAEQSSRFGAKGMEVRSGEQPCQQPAKIIVKANQYIVLKWSNREVDVVGMLLEIEFDFK